MSEILIAIEAALRLVETLLPRLEELLRGGRITAQQQAAVLQQFNQLRARANELFAGDEWRSSK